MVFASLVHLLQRILATQGLRETPCTSSTTKQQYSIDHQSQHEPSEPAQIEKNKEEMPNKHQTQLALLGLWPN